MTVAPRTTPPSRVRARTGSMIRHHGTEVRRVEHIGEREAGVVGGRVEVSSAAHQGIAPEPGLSRLDGKTRQHLVRVGVSEERQQIIKRQPGGEFPARHARPAIDRPEERQGPHEVGRHPEQMSPFGTRLEDQVQISLLQVAQAAVHQSRRSAGGPAGEVVFVDERHRQPAQRGVAGDPRPGDPAADDQDVEFALGERREHRVSGRRRHCAKR